MSSLAGFTGPTFNTYQGFPSLIPDNEDSYAAEFNAFPYSLIQQETPSWKKVLEVAKDTFNKIEKEFKFYYKIVMKIVKSTHKLIGHAFSETEEKINKLINYLGLASILKAGFILKSFYDDSVELEKCVRIGDTEGIIWKSLDLAIKPFDLGNSILSFGKSLDKIIGISWITLFSFVVAPLSLALLCYETIKSVYNLIMISIELSQMPTSADRAHYLDFRNYLEEKVGVTKAERKKIEAEVQDEYSIIFASLKHKKNSRISLSPKIFVRPREKALETLEREAEKELNKRVEVLKDRKINRLERHIDRKIVAYMKKAKEYVDENPGKDISAEHILSDIRMLTIRKLIFNVGDTLFNIAEVIMSIVSMIIPYLTAVVPLGLSLASTGFSITKNFYQTYGMGNGLHNPEFYPA